MKKPKKHKLKDLLNKWVLVNISNDETSYSGLIFIETVTKIRLPSVAFTLPKTHIFNVEGTDIEGHVQVFVVPYNFVYSKEFSILTKEQEELAELLYNVK